MNNTRQLIENFILNELKIDLASIEEIEIRRQANSQLKEIKIIFKPVKE